MKLRFSSSALVFLVAMTMATGAFAQGIFTLSAGSTSRGRSNGHAELAGGITLFLENGTIAAGDEGEVEIDFGVPITNRLGDGAIEVQICNQAVGAADNNVDIDEDDGTITLTVDGDVGGTDADDTVAILCNDMAGEDNNTINVTGVRVSLVGSGLSALDVSVRVSEDVRLIGDNTDTVIVSIVDPLTDDDVDVEDKVTITRHTGEIVVGGRSKSRFTLAITEPHNDSFTGGQLELTFSGLPEDVDIVDVDAWVTTKRNFDRDDDDDMKTAPLQVPVRLMDAPNNDESMVGSAAQDDADRNGEVIVYLQGANTIDAVTSALDADPPVVGNAAGGTLSGRQDVILVQGTITGTDDEDLLPIDIVIDATVDLGPTGDEEDTEIPRFESDPTTAVTVIESSPSRTRLSAPFVANDGSYQTGVAVANMSFGRNAQPGAITLALSVGGDTMRYTTSAGSPGMGLNAAGMLEPGGTWAVLLHEVFPGNPGNGYLTISTDFTGADANIFITDFVGFSVTGTVRK